MKRVLQFDRTTNRLVQVNESSNESVLILYITNNDRFFVFDRFLDELKSASGQYHLLIVNTSPENMYADHMRGSGVPYTFACVPCPRVDYLPKIRYGIDFAKQYGFKYVMKCDNDIIIPAYTLTYMYANRGLVLSHGLTLSPSLSTGIPSVEYFIESLCTPEEIDLIRSDFKQCVFHDQETIFDYRPLNKCTVGADRWDPTYYFRSLKELSDSMITDVHGRDQARHCRFYRGMHPVRHGFGNKRINDLIIKNRNRVFADKECFVRMDENYLCDMCFMISTKNYNQLMNVENLVIDGCDEVPLNRYAWNTGLKHLIVHHGYAIHITYNWRWTLNNQDGGSNIDKPAETIAEFEEDFVKSLYSKQYDMCIMYLTDRNRHYTFEHTVRSLAASRANFHLLVLTHDNDTAFYETFLKDTAISYTLKNVPANDNYMAKVRITLNFARLNGIPYIVKHDNDILMSAPVYDYMFEQRGVLEDETNLLLTPTITSGIPTVDLFIEDYLTPEEKAILFQLFTNHIFQPMWGVDYRSLTGTWDPAVFYEKVKAIQHHYKGIHPIRVSASALAVLNEFIVCKYRDQIVNPDTYSLTRDTESPYFCDSLFCIRTDTYRKIVSSPELFVDAFDEVPLNKWRDARKQAIVVIRRGTAVHFMYNLFPKYVQTEYELVNRFFETSR